MLNFVNNRKSIHDEEMEEELIELLGEFADVLTSMADFSARLYDRISEGRDEAFVDDYDDDEGAEEAVPDEAIHEMAVARARGLTQLMLVLDPLDGPQLIPESLAMEMLAAKGDNVDIESLKSDIYLVFDKASTFQSGDGCYTGSPVFVVKGKPDLSDLRTEEIADIVCEMEKRKEIKRTKDGKPFPVFRIR